MKIEIDFSKPESLRKQKRELEMALATIDGALAAINKNGRDVETPPFPQIAGAIPMPAPSGDVETIISQLPNQFSMRDAKFAADLADIPDSKLRREITKMIESGALVMTERGQGRRPASFRKA
jgi:hypothetical protein